SRGNGFFIQERVGLNQRHFKILKIKTMRPDSFPQSNITISNDPRITFFGRFFRATKIDELPQLFNVLVGNMSFVGPRPDVPGYVDKLEDQGRIISSIRPGITGPATLAFRNEENLLSLQTDPETYNRDIIYPKKVLINVEYIKNWSVLGDIKYIAQTVLFIFYKN
ncbi:MAG: sugar transferase, partial [Pseudomonadota bacterium]|nr:sugar transferase [Pseudomonadota bacterium]